MLVFDSSTVSLLGTNRNRGGAEKKRFLSFIIIIIISMGVIHICCMAGCTSGRVETSPMIGSAIRL